ncbi:YbaK/EbsC family protein [Desulfoscipio geothermicus]|uniref:Cys-tRNA(Pro) deacylase n=1 Tax=Desulfoscipio geothermicus DSM 3669 TaxID=1121426 RepID=A0A1I6DYE1_9FIRM|nr:YbaK/EbsC family protein [Desulfoscipio geothermicus]SFR10550.1 Cys-tRNA(Pro) deacylase [Desulfoscipio geothermicus DSM 3669]
MLQAVLFDLDGTLLQMDTEDFMNEYLKELSQTVASVVEPGRFVRALLASTNAMLVNRDPALTNAEVFWADFRTRLGDCITDLEPLIEDFYAHKFINLSRVARPCPQARRAVQAALDRGLRIVLATNAIFPRSAIRDRMAWAGVADLPWELVTGYEEMHFCKPHPEYYREIAELLELKPEDCLMVGNDVQKDLAASTPGMRTYLVTDYLINPTRVDYQKLADGYGTLAELAGWLAGAGREKIEQEKQAVERVRKFVQVFDPNLEPIEFKEDTSTVEEAARTLGVEPGRIAKTLLFRAGEKYGLFVMAGDVRVNTKKVKALLGGGKPRMATPEEVEEITGYRVGGVCPFALATDIPIYLDESLQRFDVFYPAAGTDRSALPVTFAKLQAITGGTVVDVIK